MASVGTYSLAEYRPVVFRGVGIAEGVRGYKRPLFEGVFCPNYCSELLFSASNIHCILAFWAITHLKLNLIAFI